MANASTRALPPSSAALLAVGASPQAALPNRGSSAMGSLPDAWVSAAPVRAGPSIKTWSDEEGAMGAKKSGHSCWVRFKFSIWLGTVLLLVAAGVGLSVTMAVVMNNRNAGNPSTPSNGEDGSGGSDSGGSGNTSELPLLLVVAGQGLLWFEGMVCAAAAGWAMAAP